jgi:hypothetical protein
MNLSSLMRAYDALMALRAAARRFTGSVAPGGPSFFSPSAGTSSEARLTGIVVAALKEAFNRDHARLELEQAQLAEERRRQEEALRLELYRQAADRELGRLRLIAGTALVGWLASVALVIVHAGASTSSRVIVAGGWVFLLAAIATGFTAQGRVGVSTAAHEAVIDAGPAGAASLWLLIGGLALTAASLLV